MIYLLVIYNPYDLLAPLPLCWYSIIMKDVPVTTYVMRIFEYEKKAILNPYTSLDCIQVLAFSSEKLPLSAMPASESNIVFALVEKMKRHGKESGLNFVIKTENRDGKQLLVNHCQCFVAKNFCHFAENIVRAFVSPLTEWNCHFAENKVRPFIPPPSPNEMLILSNFLFWKPMEVLALLTNEFKCFIVL